MSKIDEGAATKAIQTLNGNDRDFVELDVNEARQKARESAGKRQLEEDLELDLEETLPQPVRVRFVEYKEVPILDDENQPVLDNEGQPMVRNEARPRIAIIATYVPTELLTKVMAYRKKLESLEKLDPEESYEDIIKIYSECVLEVWKLSEEKMTLARLRKGLKFQYIRSLFARFFKSLNV